MPGSRRTRRVVVRVADALVASEGPRQGDPSGRAGREQEGDSAGRRPGKTPEVPVRALALDVPVQPPGEGDRPEDRPEDPRDGPPDAEQCGEFAWLPAPAGAEDAEREGDAL